MKFCVLTCTGGRPDLFRLCQRYVDRQTVKPDVWIVTDDMGGMPPVSLPDYAQFHNIDTGQIREGWAKAAPWTWTLVQALKLVPADHALIIMEDDDWYGPMYCELMLDQLKNHETAQLANLPRYNVPARRWSIDHVSRNTDKLKLVPGIFGCRYSGIETVIKSISAVHWEWFPIHYFNSTQFCGIKGVGYGLPGRRGATAKHSPTHRKTLMGKPDNDWQLLRHEIGEDADHYIKMLCR